MTDQPFPLTTGTARSVRITQDRAADGTPLLDIVTDRGGDNLTVDQVETVGLAILGWARTEQRAEGANL